MADDTPSEASSLPEAPVVFRWATLWRYTGPGFLMSIAYLDPGNIEADLQAGSKTGYSLLWVLFWATFMGLILQNLSVKLGIVTGKHLAEHCAEEFPRPIRYTLWLMAEIAIICVDCQEVVGTAIAIYILSDGKVPIWGGVLLTALYTFTFLLMDRCVRKLEMMFGILIAIMSVSFGAQYFARLPPQGDVIAGVVLPGIASNDTNEIPTAVGLIGAVIMPHNLYLHSALVLTRGVNIADKAAVQEAVYYGRIDASMALLFSFVINLFVVCVFAQCRTFTAADNSIGLREAGDRLSSQACSDGTGAYKYIFAIGLLASGQAATVTSTYAGQYVMQGYLDLKVSMWARATLSRVVALGPGLVVGVFAAERSDAMQEWLNVVQSIQLPFAIIPLLYFTSSVEFLGEDWASGRAMHVGGWGIALVVVLANIYLVVSMIADALDGDHSVGVLVVVAVLILVAVALYVGLVGWLFLGAMGYVNLKQLPDVVEHPMHLLRTQDDHSSFAPADNAFSMSAASVDGDSEADDTADAATAAEAGAPPVVSPATAARLEPEVLGAWGAHAGGTPPDPFAGATLELTEQ